MNVLIIFKNICSALLDALFTPCNNSARQGYQMRKEAPAADAVKERMEIGLHKNVDFVYDQGNHSQSSKTSHRPGGRVLYNIHPR